MTDWCLYTHTDRMEEAYKDSDFLWQTRYENEYDNLVAQVYV